MLVSLSVSNFRSFSTEQTFSLVASKKLSGNHEQHTAPIPDSDERVLRAAVLYGANGAGKSNLFKAIRYVESLVFRPRKKNTGTAREAFRFADASTEPSTFDLLFIAANKLYRYGVAVDDARVTKEWLVHVVGGRDKSIYERVTDEHGKVTVEASREALKLAGDKLDALVTVGAPQNQTFLATIEDNLQLEDVTDDLRSVLHWFRDELSLIAPEATFYALGHKLASEPDFLQFAGEFLKSASTGVDHLTATKKEISEEGLQAMLPARLASEIIARLDEDEDGDGVWLPLGDGNELLFERKDASHYYHISVRAAHQHGDGDPVSLNLSEESDGTRRLLNLLPAIYSLRTSAAVYFVDEIDRSMHPVLVWKFVDFFLKSCASGRGQLILTTHESNLLDLELLRRDEIWFAEKDQQGMTQLYSLMEFRVRKDLEIRKHYLQGRFGAIPFLGSLDALIDSEER